jgi:hypothetical protein
MTWHNGLRKKEWGQVDLIQASWDLAGLAGLKGWIWDRQWQ